MADTTNRRTRKQDGPSVASATTQQDEASSADGQLFTLEDLQRLTHLAAIHGKVYDLARWAPSHPGGDDLRLFGGYDATVHYHMLHPFQAHLKSSASSPVPVFPAAFEACCVGRLVSSPSSPSSFPPSSSPTAAATTTPLSPTSSAVTCLPDGFVYNSPFARDLISTVYGYFKTNKLSPHATPQFWARLIFYCSLFFVSVVAFAFSPSLLRALIAGTASAWIGLCVQHDANHGALSSDPLVNKIAGSMADLIGQCRFLWMQQHVVHHHAYTNDHACDRDSTSAEPFLFFNPPVPKGLSSPTAHGTSVTGQPNKRSAFFKFQHLFLFIVLPFYYLLRFDLPTIFNIAKYADTPKNSWLLQTHRVKSVALWAIHMTWFYVLPLYWHFSWTTALLCHVRDVTTSLILATLFMLSHNAMPVKRFPKRDSCWYAMQVETSCTYGGRIAGWLSGGLNFQIEHHVFPRVCSTHYPTLSPLVREVCRRHNVSYTYFPTIVENLASTLAYMRKVGLAGIDTGF